MPWQMLDYEQYGPIVLHFSIRATDTLIGFRSFYTGLHPQSFWARVEG